MEVHLGQGTQSRKLCPSQGHGLFKGPRLGFILSLASLYLSSISPQLDIENSIMESVYNKAINHLSLITKLCEIVGCKLGRMKKGALQCDL